MAKFVAKHLIKHQGLFYKAGEIIELTEAEAAAMPRVVARIVEKAPEQKAAEQKVK